MRQHLLALRQNRAGPIAIGRRQLLQTRREHSQRVARFVQRALAVGVDVGAGQGLRSKGRILRRPGQCSMQFGGTHGQHPHQCQIGFMRVDGRRIAGRRGSILFKMTLQILERVSPTIALIGNIALQHRQQPRLAVVRDIFERAGQRRAVRIVRDLGEVPAHLEFRICAGAQPAVALEHQPLTDGDDGIRARAARPIHLQCAEILSRQSTECTGPTELQLALGHGALLARCHRRHDRAAEHFVRKGVAHHADIRLLAYLGHRRGRQIAHPLLVALLPGQCERQKVAGAFAGRLKVEQRHQPAELALLPQHVIRDARALDRGTFCRIPALRLDVAGQGIRLELQAGLFGNADAPRNHPVAKQAGPPVEQHQHRTFVDGHDLLVP